VSSANARAVLNPIIFAPVTVQIDDNTVASCRATRGGFTLDVTFTQQPVGILLRGWEVQSTLAGSSADGVVTKGDTLVRVGIHDVRRWGERPGSGAATAVMEAMRGVSPLNPLHLRFFRAAPTHARSAMPAWAAEALAGAYSHELTGVPSPSPAAAAAAPATPPATAASTQSDGMTATAVAAALAAAAPPTPPAASVPSAAGTPSATVATPPGPAAPPNPTLAVVMGDVSRLRRAQSRRDVGSLVTAALAADALAAGGDGVAAPAAAAAAPAAAAPAPAAAAAAPAVVWEPIPRTTPSGALVTVRQVPTEVAAHVMEEDAGVLSRNLAAGVTAAAAAGHDNLDLVLPPGTDYRTLPSHVEDVVIDVTFTVKPFGILLAGGTAVAGIVNRTQAADALQAADEIVALGGLYVWSPEVRRVGGISQVLAQAASRVSADHPFTITFLRRGLAKLPVFDVMNTVEPAAMPRTFAAYAAEFAAAEAAAAAAAAPAAAAPAAVAAAAPAAAPAAAVAATTAAVTTSTATTAAAPAVVGTTQAPTLPLAAAPAAPAPAVTTQAPTFAPAGATTTAAAPVLPAKAGARMRRQLTSSGDDALTAAAESVAEPPAAEPAVEAAAAGATGTASESVPARRHGAGGAVDTTLSGMVTMEGGEVEGDGRPGDTLASTSFLSGAAALFNSAASGGGAAAAAAPSVAAVAPSFTVLTSPTAAAASGPGRRGHRRDYTGSDIGAGWGAGGGDTAAAMVDAAAVPHETAVQEVVASFTSFPYFIKLAGGAVDPATGAPMGAYVSQVRACAGHPHTSAAPHTVRSSTHPRHACRSRAARRLPRC